MMIWRQHVSSVWSQSWNDDLTPTMFQNASSVEIRMSPQYHFNGSDGLTSECFRGIISLLKWCLVVNMPRRHRSVHSLQLTSRWKVASILPVNCGACFLLGCMNIHGFIPRFILCFIPPVSYMFHAPCVIPTLHISFIHVSNTLHTCFILAWSISSRPVQSFMPHCKKRCFIPR